MIPILLEIVAILAVAGHLTYLRYSLHRRQSQAWDLLVAQLQPKLQQKLQPNFSGHELQQRFNGNAGQNATPEERWQNINGAHGLWALYEDARVMLDMANYAARNSDTVDQKLLASLRSDAVQIRICVLLALSKYACSQVNETTWAQVSRAAAIYAGMMDHMAQLLQANDGALVTRLASAM